MAVREIFLLGNSKLYEISEPLRQEELHSLKPIIQDLHDTMMDFREKYQAGRAIAAPQIGFRKRLIYMHVDKPVVFINPTLEPTTDDQMVVWDDCMCFPDLLVKVLRYKRCRITYRDMDWQERVVEFEDNLAELLQHEYDHIDGILAVSRAIDSQSFGLRSQRDFLNL